VKSYGCNSEYGQLSSVLLYRPGKEIHNYPFPAEIQHLRPIDHALLSQEIDNIVKTYQNLGIQVIEIDPEPLGTDLSYHYNMMYCHDLFFMTPAGVILASMANSTRREEPRYVERTLTKHGIPLIGKICGTGRFEGADAIWLNDRLVAVGIGYRTNLEGFEQVREILKGVGIGIESLPLLSSQTRTQHLLGSVQIVDRHLALVRSGICNEIVINSLRNEGFSVIEIPENDEVKNRQAMNIVTVAPWTIIMTAGCPETKKLYMKAGLTIAAELELTQFINGAGGVACATGILSRINQ